MLTVLSVAYPLAPVGPDAVGGAEQVLSALDRALVAAGHRSLVVACEGSNVAGRLLRIPAAGGKLDDAAQGAAQAAVRHVLASVQADVIHLHGIDFDTYLPPAGATCLGHPAPAAILVPAFGPQPEPPRHLAALRLRRAGPRASRPSPHGEPAAADRQRGGRPRPCRR